MPAFSLTDTSDYSDEAYQDYILQGVSRTFALTIPQLPPPLQVTVGNAYLLCRIADTIEDDVSMTPDGKNKFAGSLLDVIDGNTSAGKFAAALAMRLATTTPVAEVDLIRNTPRVIRITHGFNSIQRNAIRRCIGIMTRGMVQYQQTPPGAGLRDINDIRKYCYHVAGVVGEMLTDLFCEHDRQIHVHREQLMQLAPSFGLGLQLTNILKDIWEDYEDGICWLPRDVFHQYGVDLSELKKARESRGFAKGMLELVGITHLHLKQALAYTLLIPPREKGIRRFCLWCIGLAMMSLRKIHDNPHFTKGEEVKVSRRTVYSVITLSNLCVSSDKLVKSLFHISELGLPMADTSKLDDSHVNEGLS